MMTTDYKFEVAWHSYQQPHGRIMVRETVTGQSGFAEYGPMDERDGLAFVEARKRYWMGISASVMKHQLCRCTVGQLCPVL